MNSHRVWGRFLAIQFVLIKVGLLNCVAIAIFILGLICSQWVIPKLNSQSDMRQQILSKVERRLNTPPESLKPQLSIAEKRLADFYGALGSKEDVEEYVKNSLLLVQDAGLILNQADYKYSFNTNGNFYAYQITFPIKGPYASIRQFCEKFLYTFPFASLDEMTFRRDSISSQIIEARIRFTLYILPKKLSGQAISKSASNGEEL